MTTLPNMNLVLPTEGGSSGVWATILDTAFAVIDGHTHLTGSGLPIVSGALNINADVPWNGFSITGAEALALAAVATSGVAGYVNALFTNVSDNNLYFRNASGTNVQITSGSTINVSVVGGIGGDYASVSALLSYDDSTKRYLLQQEVISLARPWAGLATADIDLYQKASAIANKVTLKSPSALAASYPLVFPPALPANALPLTSDTSGNLTFSSTFGTLVTAPDFKNTTPVSTVISAAIADIDGNQRLLGSGGGMTGVVFSTTTPVTFSCPIPNDATVTGYSVSLFKSSSSGTSISAQLYTVVANSTETAQGSGSSTSANNPSGVQLSEVLSVSLGSGTVKGVYLKVISSAMSSDFVMGATILYRRA